VPGTPATGGDSCRNPGLPRSVVRPLEGRQLYLVFLQCFNHAAPCGKPRLADSRAFVSAAKSVHSEHGPRQQLTSVAGSRLLLLHARPRAGARGHASRSTLDQL